jgi:hypothetical protein
MDLDDAGSRVKFVLHDRYRLFHEGFEAVFISAGVRIVGSGVRVPRMNAIMERWIGTRRRELLDRTLIWNLPLSCGCLLCGVCDAAVDFEGEGQFGQVAGLGQ